MPTVIEVDGYAVRVFTRDHGNPHVHVYHNGTLMKIWLDHLDYDSYKGRKPRAAERAKALELVGAHHTACMTEWKKIYG